MAIVGHHRQVTEGTWSADLNRVEWFGRIGVDERQSGRASAQAGD
jgi:hypothetical protein